MPIQLTPEQLKKITEPEDAVQLSEVSQVVQLSPELLQSLGIKPATPSISAIDDFQSGLVRGFSDNITGKTFEAVGVNIKKELGIQKDESAGLSGKIGYGLGTLLDPAGFAIGGGAAKAVAPIAKLASPLVRSLITGGAFGATGAAAQSAVDDWAAGKPVGSSKLAKTAAIGTVLGAGLNASIYKLANKAANSATVKTLVPDMAKQFETPAAGNAFIMNKQALAKQQKTVRILQSELAKAERMMQPAYSEETRATASKVAARARTLLAEAEQAPEIKMLKEAQARVGERTWVTPDGEEKRVMDDLISPRNVFSDADTVEKAMSVNDVKRGLGTDISRFAEKVDGQARGWFKINFPEKAAAAKIAGQRAYLEAQKRLIPLYNKMQSAFKKDGRLLVEWAEKRLSDEDAIRAGMGQAEFDFVRMAQKEQNLLYDALDKAGMELGFAPLKRRANHFVMAHKKSLAEKLGFQNFREAVVSEFHAPQKTRQIFQFSRSRTGGASDYVKNSMEAVDLYLKSGYENLYMMRPAAEMQAAARFMPAWTRDGVTSWVNTNVLHNQTMVDQAVIRGIGQGPLRMLEQSSALAASGVILSNMNVVVQQASQMIMTGMWEGIRPMLKGIVRAATPSMRYLERDSNFLPFRTIKDDAARLSSSTLRSFQKFAGFLLDVSDRYVSRASWHAGYDNAIRQGYSHAAATRYADLIADKLHGSYDKLYRVPLTSSRTGKALLPFQTFAFNLWNNITKDQKLLAQLRNRNKLAQYMRTIGSIWATNELYQLVGFPAPFDVIATVGEGEHGGIILPPLLSSARTGLPSPVVRAGLKELSGVLGVASGGPMAASGTIFGHLVRAATADDEDLRMEEFGKAFGQVGSFIPFAGRQLVSTLQGLDAARRGYYKVGHEEVDLSTWDMIESAVFGPHRVGSVARTRRALQWQRSKKFFGGGD